MHEAEAKTVGFREVESERPLDLADLWHYAVDEQDRKGLSFKDLQDNFGELSHGNCVTAVYKAYKTTLQRRLKNVQSRINSGRLTQRDAINLAELQECLAWLAKWT